MGPVARIRRPAVPRLGGRWHLASTILTSFAASLIALALLGALSWQSAMRSIESGRRVTHSQEVMRALNDFRAQMYRAHANQRGWLLTGGKALRDQRDDAMRGAARALETLERLDAGGLGPAADRSRLRGLVADRAAHFAHLDRVEHEQGRERAIAAFEMADAEKVAGEVVGGALAAEERRLAERKAAERSTVRMMYGAFAGIGCVLVAGLLLVFRRMHGELRLRERSEALARDAGERLERALGASRMVLWESDLRTDSTSFNRRLDDPTGELRLPTRVPARELAELVYPDERAYLCEAVAHAVSGPREEWAAEHRMRGPGGEWLWVMSRGRVFERDAASGRALRLSGTSVDITERKLAEERLRALNEDLEQRVRERTRDIQVLFDALRESEQRLNAVISSALDAVVIADDAQNIVLFNPAAERMFGYRAADVIGAPIERLMPERFRGAHRGHVTRFGASGASNRKMGETGRVVGLRADGSEFPVDASIARFELGGRRFLTVLCRDATEQARAECEIRDLNAQLERRVAERTGALEAANRDLEAFSYSVSHDLQAPIRALDGFARLLEESDGARISDVGRRFLGVIRANSKRMGTLVADLLRLSRVGREALHREAVDVAALARQAADELQARQPAAHIEIGALPPARADRALLRQALVNLLDNALKYSSARPDPVVTVGAASRDGETAYFVRDNGAGFDPQYAGKLFEPFQRLHGAEFEGSGIGLAIVRRIVERHGGSVWAESAPGQGASFYFTLGPALGA